MPRRTFPITRLPSGRHRARPRDATGAQLSRTFNTRAEAEDFCLDVANGRRTGTAVDVRRREITFQDWTAQWSPGQVWEPTTRAAFASSMHHVFAHVGKMPLGAIRTSDVQAMTNALVANGLAPGTIHKVLQHTAQVFNGARLDGVLLRSPTEGVKRPAVPRESLTVDLNHLPDAAGLARIAEAMDARWRATVWLAAGCGLRQGEVLGIGRDQIDALGRRLRIVRQLRSLNGRHLVPPKHGSIRDVPAPDLVLAALARHVAEHPNDDPDRCLFVSARGSKLSRQYFRRAIWQPAVDAAGLPDVTFHNLRDFYATSLLRAGVPVQVVAEYLGHKDPSVTLRYYAKVIPADAEVSRDAIERAMTPGRDRVSHRRVTKRRHSAATTV